MRERGLASFLATPTVVVTGSVLMGVPEAGPLADQWRQALMEQVQARDPGTNQTQGWCQGLGCGMLSMLHAFLLSRETWVVDNCSMSHRNEEG